MEDGKQILGKFGFGASHSWIENQQLPAVLFKEEAEQVEAEPGKPIPMGNHKPELISAQEAFQYGEQSFPFEVEPGANVFDDFGLRVEGAHALDLSLKVVALLGGTDPAVTDGACPGSIPQPSVNVVETMSGRAANRGKCSIVCVFP
jgi:hypothetical protein